MAPLISTSTNYLHPSPMKFKNTCISTESKTFYPHEECWTYVKKISARQWRHSLRNNNYGPGASVFPIGTNFVQVSPNLLLTIEQKWPGPSSPAKIHMINKCPKKIGNRPHRCCMTPLLHGVVMLLPRRWRAPRLDESIVQWVPDIHRESKKQDTKLLPITSPRVNQFSKFFSWQTQL